jgi:hypothetical protein
MPINFLRNTICFPQVHSLGFELASPDLILIAILTGSGLILKSSDDNDRLGL